MASNTKVGVWTPLKGKLPNPDSTIDFAQYYVMADGTNAELGLSFRQGDWLIYIVDDDGEKHWYKTEGGMVTVSNVGTTSSAPDAGWYSKVFINDNGDLTEGDYLQADDLPKHTHDVSEIENVPNKVWEVLADIFQNQKLGNVKFDVNAKLHKITASVVVDEETIGTNEYGELYAILSGDSSGTVDLSGTSIKISQVENLTAELNQIRSDINDAKNSSGGFVDVNDIPIDEQTITINKNGKLQANTQKNLKHTHSVKDITDFPEKCLIPASKQMLESDHVYFDQGALNLNGTLDEALYKINSYLKGLSGDVITLQNQSGKIQPAEPHNSEYCKTVILNESVIAQEKYTRKEVSAKIGPKLKIHLSDIYPANSGAIRFFIDNEEVDSLSLQDISVPGNYNNSYVDFVDSYAGNVNMEGFFTSALIEWTSPVNLSAGEHTFFIKHTDEREAMSQRVSFIMVNPHGKLQSTVEKSVIPTNNSFVSGIPCIALPTTEMSVTLTVPWEELYIPQNFISTNDDNYEYLPSNEGVIRFKLYKSFENSNGIKNLYLTLKDYDGTTILNDNFNSGALRYDRTDCEQYRLIYDTDSDSYISYDPSRSLPSADLPIEQGIIGQLKNYSFYNGPDYTGQIFKTEYGKSVREITFALPCTDFINSFYVDLETKDQVPFEEVKGKLNNIIVCACLTNATQPNYWVNTLNPFDGSSNFQDPNFGALDLARTTLTRKYITFGKLPPLEYGTLFIKFLLEDNITLNVEKAVNSILESIKESLC